MTPLTLPERPLGPGEAVADFELPIVTGGRYRLSEHRGEVTVVDFWSAECPISRHHDAYLSGFAESYHARGVAFVAIDSNVYEDEAAMLHTIQAHSLTFPVLRDEGNRVADYFGALTTPHLFVLDRAGRLRYRGPINDVTFQNKVATINYLEEVVDALLLGEELTIHEREPYGCTINRAWEG